MWADNTGLLAAYCAAHLLRLSLFGHRLCLVSVFFIIQLSTFRIRVRSELALGLAIRGWGRVMKRINVLLFIGVLGFFLTSCSKSKDNPVNSPLNSAGDPIISPQFDPEEVTFRANVPRFMTLIQLKSPALLASATRDAQGRYQISEQAKQQVLKEQQDLEAELQKISPDIRIVFRYRMVLNALAIDAQQAHAGEINNLDVQFIEADERFESPATFKSVLSTGPTVATASKTSMGIIGAAQLNQKMIPGAGGQLMPIKGQGVRVGVIDSGIDYTHTMLGGAGDESIFNSITADADTAYFPNSKVVGGRDFVGTTFGSSSHLYDNRIPRPDNNPIDRTGHGTHVAGSIAGLGDGVETYDGAAPDAELYALKVFGDFNGGTNDTAVIAALEYAADPNEDLNPNDRLHVVNLSLGYGSGKPHSLYNVAVKNLTHAGTLTVAAACNDGPIKNIVCSPSTADDALSVAASIDDREELWQFPAVEIQTVDHPQLTEIMVEGATTKPIETAGNVQGRLVYMGLAAQDFTPDQSSALNGNIALIDRGEVAFDDKIHRAAAAGAIGVVTINNVDGEAFTMGGEGTFDIPGVMITKTLGDLVKQQMTKGPANFQFVSSQKAKIPELIDTIVSFSSQGPRTIDSKIKPEITAPGYFIVSAAMGSGRRGAGMSGTSMAAPHVAGLAALVFQARPNVTPLDVKSLLMNSSELIDDRAGLVYPISRQGAGRANVLKAVAANVVFEGSSVSLGEVQVDDSLQIIRPLKFKNIGDDTVNVGLSAVGSSDMTISFATASFSLAPQQSITVDAMITLQPTATTVTEIDAFIRVNEGNGVVSSIPVLAVVSRLTKIGVTAVSVDSNQNTVVSLNNTSTQMGEAYLFQWMGRDSRKPLVLDPSLSSACDLESVGYRLIQREQVAYMQFAVKLYNPINTWTVCDLGVEFDFNQDGQTDQELIGTTIESIAGLSTEPVLGFRSTFFDSQKMRDIIAEYRKQLALQGAAAPQLDFKPALLANEAMFAFDHSTFAIVEVPMSLLSPQGHKPFNVRVGVLYNDAHIIEREDVLNLNNKEWHSMSLGQLRTTEEVVALGNNQAVTAQLPAQLNSNLWVGYFPRNEFIQTLSGQDTQSFVFEPQATFSFPFLN